jgi:alpha-galactosidase
MNKLACVLACICVSHPVAAQKFEGLAPTPPMGWNPWNAFEGNISERIVQDTAEAMIENGMRDAGYVYINLDDAWMAASRDEQGDLVGDPAKFPHGMRALGNFLHSRGFKFGIYNCAGTETCAGYPGGQGHEFQDARTYASWGVDYLKYDWCHCGTANSADSYRRMSEAIRAAGRPMVFSLCEWGEDEPWLWAAPLAHLWRTTQDIDPHYARWREILAQQVGLEKYAGPGRWNDPDMLEIGEVRGQTMTLAEQRAQFSFWCMLAAPLMAGNDLRHMTAEVRGILLNREAISIDQDPLGKQGFQVLVEPDREIWAKPLSGGDWAVCILNPAAAPASLTVDWGNLTFPVGRTCGVRDVWAGKDLGTTAAPTVTPIEPHGVLLVRLHPAQ